MLAISAHHPNDETERVQKPWFRTIPLRSWVAIGLRSVRPPTLVALLLLPRCPANIAWFVIAIVIGPSINAVLRCRLASHICKEVFVSVPALTD